MAGLKKLENSKTRKFTMTMQLTPQRERFAQELAKGLSQSEAYRNAFPKSRQWKDATLWPKASRMAADDKVRARMAELLRTAAMNACATAEEILRETSRVARSDMRRLYRADGTLKHPTEWDDETAAAVQGVEWTQGGLIKRVRMADKNAALERLFKHHGLFGKDNRQHSDPLVELLQSLKGNVLGVAGAGKER